MAGFYCLSLFSFWFLLLGGRESMFLLLYCILELYKENTSFSFFYVFQYLHFFSIFLIIDLIIILSRKTLHFRFLFLSVFSLNLSSSFYFLGKKQILLNTSSSSKIGSTLIIIIIFFFAYWLTVTSSRNTVSRTFTEIKQRRTWLLPRWVTVSMHWWCNG